MKRGVFLLASLVLTSALYSQAEGGAFTREQVLEIFAQYNPSVLEKAQENQTYQQLVDEFVKAFEGTDRAKSRMALIAATRNFDNSIRLHALTNQYAQQSVWAYMSGAEVAGIRTQYRQNVKEIMSGIFAVTLQAKQWELQDLKASLKKTRRAELSKQEKQTRVTELKAAITQQKQEIKALKKNAGEMVIAFTEQQVARANQQVQERISAQQQQAVSYANSSRQAANLQVKTNHKKPVAK